MLALRSAPPVFSAAQVEQIAVELYGLSVVARPLPGERDCNFQIRTAEGSAYVIKLIDGADPLAVDCQIGVLRHLAEQDPKLPVPRVCLTSSGVDQGSWLRDGIAYATCLLDFLPGQLLSESTASPQLMRSVGVAVAQTDRALRGYFHAALAQPLAWTCANYPA